MKKFYFLICILLVTKLALAQPANDTCASAEMITVSNTETSFTFDINTATISNQSICNTTDDFADVWYQFTMPINGNLFVDGNIGWNKFALYNSCGTTAIDCGTSKKLFTNLTAGNTYLLQVYRTDNQASYTSYQGFSIRTYNQATNDTCATSENISISTATTGISFEMGGATINNEEGCIGTTNDYLDLWYDFTMPFDGNIYIHGSVNYNNFALYDTCNGSQIHCGDANEFIDALTSGTNYKLRVFRTTANVNNSYLGFTITAYEEASNDDCASAENIALSTTETSIDFNIAGASIHNEEGCTGTTNDYLDVWYEFTMPVNGNIYIHGSVSYNNFAIYDTCSGTQIHCGDTNEFITGLTSGANYKLRVFRTISNADDNYTSFSIIAYETVANDDCASAENITVTTAETTVNFNIAGATVNNEEGCAGITNDYLDIWYNFTMPTNGNLYINGSVSYNNFALYDACNGTLVHCGATNEFITGLNTTTNYKLRVFRTVSNADNGYTAFTIQAFPEATNDTCTSSENITVTTEETSINFNIGGASINNEEGCTGTTDDYVDVWYDFTMPVHGNIFLDATVGYTYFALYDACNGTEIQCGNTNELITGLTAATNYKLRVFRTKARADDGYLNFTIQAFEIINNDDCASAENIIISNTATIVNFGIGGATINNEVGCSGSTAVDYADIWYQFTMPYDGSILVDGNISWNNFALYDACNGNEITCFSNQEVIPNLTNGTTYKLRLFRTLALADNDSYKSFSIQSAETLSANQSLLDNHIHVYPNPTDSILYISNSENQSIVAIELFNILGKNIITTKKTTLDVSAFPAGIYLLKVTTEKGQVTKRIVIQ